MPSDVTDRSVEISVQYTKPWFFNEQYVPETITKNIKVDKDGTTTFVVNPPVNVTNMNINVTFNIFNT